MGIELESKDLGHELFSLEVGLEVRIGLDR
jgi:hypothetical protein